MDNLMVFYKEQIEWYKNQVEYTTKQIKWFGKMMSTEKKLYGCDTTEYKAYKMSRQQMYGFRKLNRAKLEEYTRRYEAYVKANNEKEVIA